MYEMKNYKELIQKTNPINIQRFDLEEEANLKLVADYNSGLRDALINNNLKWDISSEDELTLYDALLNNELFGKNQIKEERFVMNETLETYVQLVESVLWNVYLNNAPRPDICKEDIEFNIMKIHVLEYQHLKRLIDYGIIEFQKKVIEQLEKLYYSKYSFEEDITYSVNMLLYTLIYDQSEVGVNGIIDAMYSRPRTIGPFDLCYGLTYKLNEAYSSVLKSRRVKKSQYFEQVRTLLKEKIFMFWEQYKIVKNRYFSYSEDDVQRCVLEKLDSQINQVLGKYTDADYKTLSLLINDSEYPDIAIGEFSVTMMQDDFKNKIRFSGESFSRILNRKGLRIEDLVSDDNGFTVNKLNNLRYGKIRKVPNKEYAYLAKCLDVKVSTLFIIEDVNELKNQYLKKWFDHAFEMSDVYKGVSDDRYRNQYKVIRQLIISEELFGPDGRRLGNDEKELLVDILNTSVSLLDKQLDEKEGIYQICEFVKMLRKAH